MGQTVSTMSPLIHWEVLPMLGVLFLISHYLFFKKTKKINSSIAKPYVEIDESILRCGFKSSAVPCDLDAVVIGSGMGGLSTAALLAKQGKKVVVLEQHYIAGGNTHVFTEKGYEFDTGLHYIGGFVGRKNSPLRKLFDFVTDNGVEWNHLGTYYDIARVRNRDTLEMEEFKMNNDVKKLIADLIDRFPEEKKAILSYFQLIRKCARIQFPLFFVYRLLPRCIASRISGLLSYVMPLVTEKTTMEVLKSLTSNKKLINVLTYIYGDYGDVPSKSAFAIQALLIDHFRGGGYYPVGGPSVIAKHMVKVIEKYGGKVFVRAPVSSLIFHEDATKNQVIGVEVKGKRILAPIVVSSVGFPNTYTKLLPKEKQSFVARELELLRNPATSPGISLMSMYVGLEGDLGELPKNNLWYFPSWDHDENLNKFTKDPFSSEFPALFISFPSAKDPVYEQRNNGKQVAVVIAPSLYEHVEKFEGKRTGHRGDEYSDMKEKWKNKMIDILVREFPQLKGKVSYVDIGTAVTNNFYLGTYNGAVYGLSHTPARFKTDCLSPSTPFNNFYMAGQDVLTCGIVGGLMSGVLCNSHISKTFILRNAKILV